MLKQLEDLEVVNTPEVANELNITKEHASVILHRLSLKGKAVKIRKGIYYIKKNEDSLRPPNRYLVASKLAPDSILSYHTALELHGIAHQQFYTVFVHSSKRFNSFTFNGITYHHVYLKKPLFDLKELVIKGNRIRTTSLERTVLDCSQNLHYSGGWEELYNSLNTSIKIDPLRVIANVNEIYHSNLSYRKVGLLFDLFKDNWKYDVKLYKNIKDTLLTKVIDYNELKRTRIFSERLKNVDLVLNPEWNVKHPYVMEREGEYV
jgi:predicted transcriptional regulator of viral defense system